MHSFTDQLTFSTRKPRAKGGLSRETKGGLSTTSYDKMTDPTRRLLQDRQACQARNYQRVVLEYDTSILIDLDIEFEQLGFIFKRGKSPVLHHNTPQLNDRRFRTAFGCCSRVCSLAWLLVVDGWTNRPKQATKIWFLWALSLLKTYDTEANMASNCGVDEKTFRKWAWFFIQELSFWIGDIVVSKLSSLYFASFLSYCCHHIISFLFYSSSFFLSFIDCVGKSLH